MSTFVFEQSCKTLLPGYAGLSESAHAKQISNLALLTRAMFIIGHQSLTANSYKKISNMFNRMTVQIKGWDKSKLTSLLRKTCVESLKAINAITSTPERGSHSGWNGGTQNRDYAKESLARLLQHVPEAIEALSGPDLPEMEAVKQDANLICGFILNRVCRKFGVLFMRHQMRCTHMFKEKCEV